MVKFYHVACFSILLLLTGLNPLAAQSIRVQGTVTDAGGKALAGATVTVDGTAIGVSADSEGRYVINAPSQSSELVFQFIGFKPAKIRVGTQKNIDVSLELDLLSMDEVVVTGYQTISRERAAGSFSKISARDWEDKRPTSVANLLEGMVAGYYDGLIRGVSTMLASSQPLYVIDGFPVDNSRYGTGGSLQSNLPDLNLLDIESFTVLKDAAASSIYGARAANGVIVITTKKAKVNETRVSFSSNLALKPYKYYTGNVADAAMIVDIEKELAAGTPAYQNPSVAQNYLNNAIYTTQGMRTLMNRYAGNIDESTMNATLNELSKKGYSYYDDLKKYGKRNELSQQYNVSLSRGGDRGSAYTSFNYKKDQLEDKYSDNESFGANIKLDYSIAKWLTVDFGSFTSYAKNTVQTYSLLNPTYAYSVYDNLVDPDGSHTTVSALDRRSVSNNTTISNYGLYSMDSTPLDEIGMNLGKVRDFSNRTYARLNLKFTDYLRYSVSFQYEYGNYDYSQLKNKESYAVRSLVNSFSSNVGGQAKYNVPYGDIYTKNTRHTNAYNFRQQLDFSKTFAEVHDVTAIAGYEVIHQKLDYDIWTRYNYDTKMLTYSRIDETMSNFNGLLGSGSISNDYIRELANRYVSLYGNAAYNYDGRYTATASLRWDRSNLWGTSSKYQDKPTWSTGVAWNIYREAFFSIPVVDMLKLRVSYGIGGNIGKDSSPYLTVSYSNNVNVGGIQGSVSTQPNPLLCWEKTATLNIGADFSLLRNRLGGSIDYYRKKSTDLLSSSYGNPTEGFGTSQIKINNGGMTNNGIEASLYGRIIQGRDFSWNASTIFAYNKNKVAHTDMVAPAYYLQLDQAESFPRIGNPLYAIYGYKWAGLNNEGLPQVYNSQGEATAVLPTDLESIVYLGTRVPVYNGSVSMDFRYRNWSLSFMFLYEGGHKIRNTFLPVLSYSYTSIGYTAVTSKAVNKSVDNRWRKAGDENETDIPRMTQLRDYIYTMADVNVLRADNLRMRNITLGYRLPKSLCSKIQMQDMRLHVSVENPFLIARSKEAKYMLKGYIAPTYVFGLNINF